MANPPVFLDLSESLYSFNGRLSSINDFFNDIAGKLSLKNEQCVQENRFTKLLEQASNGIALLSAAGKLTYVSSAVLKTFGYSEEELVNVGTLLISHPEEKEMLKIFLSELAKTPGKTRVVKYRVKDKGENWHWIQSNVTNMLHEPGINAFVFNYEDITERVNMKKQADFDKKNRDALINSTTDLLWSIDKEMRLITANTSFLNRVKANSGRELKNGDQLLNPAWVFPENIKKWKRRYKRALNGESFIVDDFIDAASFDRWEETTFHPIYENNEVIGVSCFVRDVTETRMAIEIIKQSQELMQEAQSIAQFGSWECYFDGEGNIRPHSLKWSDELFKIFGYEPQEFDVTLQKFYECIHPDDFHIMRSGVRSAFENNTGYESEYRIITGRREIKWIRTTGRVILHDGTKPIKLVGSAQDITAKKTAEEERTRLIQALMERNKDLEQFAYIVSHNLRAPVASIQGLADIFKNVVKEGEVELKCAEGILTSAHKLDDVVKDLNHILEKKRDVSEKKQLVNFSAVVSEVSNSIKQYIEKREGQVIYDFEAVPECLTVKGYMYSIFFNLISNALKYRQPGLAPVIRICSEKQGDTIVLKFKDNGMGMDMTKYGDKVFGLYQRFHEDIEGKGIGLYMVKIQVESLGGKISVKSDVDKGTEFTIEFTA